MEHMPSNTPIMDAKPGPAGWLPVWMKVVTKPSEQTFVEITQHPDANAKTAYIWVFIGGLVVGLFQALIQAVYAMLGITPQLPIPGMEQFAQQPGVADGGSMVSVLVGGLCAAPLVGLVSVLFFAIGVAITQWIAKLFGGTGTYDKLAYASAAVSVPFSIVTTLLSLLNAIPIVGICTGIISFLLGFYVLFLQIMAVKAVNRFGWGQAAGSVLIPALVILFFCGCIVIGGLMLLGPVINDVFTQINQNLAP